MRGSILISLAGYPLQEQPTTPLADNQATIQMSNNLPTIQMSNNLPTINNTKRGMPFLWHTPQ